MTEERTMFSLKMLVLYVLASQAIALGVALV